MIKNILSTMPEKIKKRIMSTNKEYLFIENLSTNWSNFKYTFTNDNMNKYSKKTENNIDVLLYITDLLEELEQ